LNSSNRLRSPWQLQVTASAPAEAFLELLPFTTSIAASEILNNEPVSFRGDLMLNPQIPGRVSIQNSRILLGRYPINARGDIAWGNQLGKRGQPVANIVAATGGPLPLLDLARLLYPSASSADVDGTFAGQMVIAGPLTASEQIRLSTSVWRILARLNVWSANGTSSRRIYRSLSFRLCA